MIPMRSQLVLAAFLGQLGVAHAQGTVIEDAVIAVGRFVEEPQHKKLLAIMVEANRTPAPFETDGCSGGMSASWAPVASVLPGFAEAYQNAPPWEECCVIHDQAYHNAQDANNAAESFDARAVADQELMQCVLDDGEDRREAIATELSTRPDVVDTAYSVIAHGMFSAVRLWGAPCSGLPWRWGYGYPVCFWE